MKIHCYFLLNIKHGASQLYLGRPPNTTMMPPGLREGRYGGDIGGGHGGSDTLPQLSSAGNVPSWKYADTARATSLSVCVCTSLRAGLAQNLWVNFHELLVTVGTVTRNNRLHFDNDLDLGVLTFENARTTSPLKEAK